MENKQVDELYKSFVKNGAKELQQKELPEAFARFPQLLEPDPNYIVTADHGSHAKA